MCLAPSSQSGAMVARSTDHRGTADQPGLVCTVLSEEELLAQGYKPEDVSSVVYGVAYQIPDELVDQVLDELGKQASAEVCLVALALPPYTNVRGCLCRLQGEGWVYAGRR